MQLVSELRAAELKYRTEIPQALIELQDGTLGNKAGSFGQYFSTWDIAAGMLRDYTGYTLYPIVRIAQEQSFNVEQIVEILDRFDPPYTNYLAYSGFTELKEFAVKVRDELRNGASPEQATEILAAFNAYVNRLNAWNHHVFPWYLGEQFRYGEPEVEDPEYARTAPKEPLNPSVPGKFVELKFEPLGITLVAELANERNPELVSEFLAGVPFTVVQSHAVVTGRSMYAWAPLVSTAPVHWKEQINQAPMGRLRFSQNTGQKLIIQWGETSEDLLAPVLGQVLPEHFEDLERVGHAVWNATFEKDADPVWITVTEIDR